MKKTFKRVLSSLAAIALLSSSFVAMQASADDVPYINIYNNQGVYGAGDNAISVYGTRTSYTDDPVMGSYSTLTGSFVHICESSNAVASTWLDNAEAGRLTVYEVDFKPDENTQLVHVYTYYTTKLTYSVDLTQLGDIVKVGEWNHLKMIIDTSVWAKSNNGVTMDRLPSAVWINGSQVLDMSISKYGNAGMTVAKFRESIAAGNTSQYLRLRFDAKSGTTTTVGIDNTRIKTVDAGDVYANDYNGSYNLVPSSVQNMTPSYVTGAAGRAADDKSYKLTATGASGYIELRVPTGKKYVKQELDILPSSNFSTYQYRTRNQQLTYAMYALTTNANTKNQWLKPNQWNHLVFISEIKSLDLTTGNAEIETTGYANGTHVSTTTKTWTSGTDASHLDFTDGNGYGRTYYPVRIGYINVDDSMVLDNIVMSVSDTEPSYSVADTIANSSVVSVIAPTRYKNGSVTALEPGVTPADITIADGSVRVYTDDTYATQVASDAVIADGSIVVATDANGIVSYYDFEGFEEKEETILNINFDNQTTTGTVGKLTTPKGIFDYVEGEAGDYALSVSNDTDKDGFSIFTAAPTTAKAIIIEYNVKPMDDNLDSICVGTGWNNAIFPSVAKAKLVKNQWNHIKAITYLDTPGAIANGTITTAKATVSVNGSDFSALKAVSPRTTGTNEFDLRFIAFSTSASDKTTVLFDDIKVSVANYTLDAETPAETYIVADNGVVNKSGERVGMYYNVLVNRVSDTLSLGVADKAFTITELGEIDATTSLTYILTGERALGDIPAVTSVKSGDTAYNKIK